MRGLIPNDRLRLQDDRGAVLPIVAAASIVIFATAALVIDLGHGWQTRRALIPATDAASLAAAQEFVEDDNGCTNGTAGAYLTLNEADANLVSCVLHPSSDSVHGWVTVTATHDVETWFAPVIGLGNYTVGSTSSAVYGPPSAAIGLRPIGLCFAGSNALQDVINNPPATEQIIRIDYDKDQADACGDDSLVPGNWGIVDFDGNPGGNPEIRQWLEHGYSDSVNFENHAVSSCSSEAHCYEGNSGADAISTAVLTELNFLRSNGIYFTLPVFNFAEGPPVMFHIMGIVRVRLVDFQITGSEANRFFELGVKPGLVAGTCCGPPSGASGNKVTVLCGVDPGVFDACDP